MINVLGRAESWPYDKPFRITGHTWTNLEVVIAEARLGDAVGRGEAAGVYYHDEVAADLAETLNGLAPLPMRHPREVLLERLPAGGARNALDCALWDLEAKIAGEPVWRLIGLTDVRPLPTVITLGADAPEQVAESARAMTGASALKLKLNGDGGDAARVSLVHRARPDVRLSVDANQGLDLDTLEQLMPTLVDTGVELLEQPFPVGCEAWLDGLGSPIPIAADESVCDTPDLETVVGRVDVINIKLDKCGGLTRGLALAKRARDLGFKLMVGNMGGTSLAMAPAFVLGQRCDYADVDGPLLLRMDRDPHVVYVQGSLVCPEAIWGDGQ